MYTNMVLLTSIIIGEQCRLPLHYALQVHVLLYMHKLYFVLKLKVKLLVFGL